MALHSEMSDMTAFLRRIGIAFNGKTKHEQRDVKYTTNGYYERIDNKNQNNINRKRVNSLMVC